MMANVTKLKNPFVGLRAFEEDEDYLFFGRTAEINDLLTKFSHSRMLAVIGSSGSGKSSLVKSGLIPAIHGGRLYSGCNWRVALMRPGDDPIGNLAAELAKKNVLNQEKANQPFADESGNGILNEESDSPDSLVKSLFKITLSRSTTGLVQAYQHAHFTTAENLLIVVDQFEELFRYSNYERQRNAGNSEAIHFVNLLLTASQQTESPIFVMITMRSDFIGDCAQFRGLPEAINEGQYLVPRMTRDEIRQAINGPIKIGGANIAQRLVTRLLNDVGNDLDQLPILQHAMMRTWNAWQQLKGQDTPIDIEDYERTGGMKSALSLHAEEIFKELSPGREQKICEQIFKALTDKAADVRGIRRPTSIKDLSELANATPEEVMRIVERFRIEGRTFLMPPPAIELHIESIIDISHESLMRIWQRLVQWTDEEAKSGSIYLELSRDAKRHEAGEIRLWEDPELGNAIKWKQDNNPGKKWAQRYNNDFDLAMAFLRKSELEAIEEENRKKEAEEKEKARIARNLRTAKIVGAVFFLLAIIAAGALVSAYFAKKEAQENLVKSYQSEIDKYQREISINKINLQSFNDYGAKDVEASLSLRIGRMKIIKDSLERTKDSLEKILKIKPK
jgi:energy-coupling factor transporter ATP-binding protein EcfA2